MNDKSNDIEVLGSLAEGFGEILSDDALQFVAELSRRFSPIVEKLLDERRYRQQAIDEGGPPPVFFC